MNIDVQERAERIARDAAGLAGVLFHIENALAQIYGKQKELSDTIHFLHFNACLLADDAADLVYELGEEAKKEAVGA